ncbi:T-complex protein 11-domain-containing protein [Lineolata rhizophorae]|uniref:T-complex protein 11-domain-containing protein n=1 Tax=Lineolata rhizophorae TaxID=578093 RepID=A0A6A6PCI0_9PEZI|nr:T-complex protein 11-domain-containing protein [Lineolata rhizophorae]
MMNPPQTPRDRKESFSNIVSNIPSNSQPRSCDETSAVRSNTSPPAAGNHDSSPEAYRRTTNDPDKNQSQGRQMKAGGSLRGAKRINFSLESARCHSLTSSPRASEPTKLPFSTEMEIDSLRLRKLLKTINGPGPTEPPITRASLSELDGAAIYRNPKLRHDINFDRELHFRPNLDGDNGRQKRLQAEKFWTMLVAEVELYNMLHGGMSYSRVESLGLEVQRVPKLFDAVRDIVITLIPPEEQTRVEERLDTKMLMQAIERGVCDLLALARWLAQLLKSHCAPMRDAWVDRFVSRMEDGVARNDSERVVSGLRELLGILEAMKLDVANHQIRYLREQLVAETISFEQAYQAGRIQRNRVNMDQAQRWYCKEQEPVSMVSQSTTIARRGAELFTSRLLQMVHHENLSTSPDTFYFDCERLHSIQSDLLDHAYFRICWDAFCRTVRILSPNNPYMPGREVLKALRTDLTAIVAHSQLSKRWPRPWHDNMANISLEIVRHAFRYCEISKEYDEERHRAIEKFLRVELSLPSERLRSELNYIQKLITPAVISCVVNFLGASPTDLVNAFVPSKGSPNVAPTSLLHALSQGQEDETFTMEYSADAMRRLVHIAVLHWKVWGPLVYLGKPDSTVAEHATASMQDSLGASGHLSQVSSKWSCAEGDIVSIREANSTIAELSPSSSPALADDASETMDTNPGPNQPSSEHQSGNSRQTRSSGPGGGTGFVLSKNQSG